MKIVLIGITVGVAIGLASESLLKVIDWLDEYPFTYDAYPEMAGR